MPASVISPSPKKVILIGDEGCGKISLIFSLLTGKMPDLSIPIICKEYPAEVDVGGVKMNLLLWKVVVQEDYSAIRPLSYADTEVILMFHSIDDPKSLKSITEKWLNEVKAHLPEVPIILVGSKLDLRSDATTVLRLHNQGLEPTSCSSAESVANAIGAQKYVECSAVTGEGVKEVFKTVVEAVLKKLEP